MKERVIYLKDLFYYICRKWRIALILMLVFALVLNFYGWYRAKKAQLAGQMTTENRLIEKRAGLSEKEAFDAENRARNYASYYRQYLSQGEYMQNSVYFNLDATAVPTYTAVYHAETDMDSYIEIIRDSDNERDYGADVLFAIRSVIESGEVEEKAAAAVGMIDKKQYIRELYTVTITGANLTLTVHAPSEEQASAIGSVISEEIDARKDEFRDIYGDYQIEKVGEQTFTNRDDEMARNQVTVINRNSALENMMKATGDNLSQSAKSYYMDLINTQAEEIVPDEGKRPLSLKKIYPKWIAVGLVAGIVVFAIFLAVVYILSDRIKTPEEVEECAGVPVLAAVREGKKPLRGIDHLLDRLFYGKSPAFSTEEGLQAIKDRIVFRKEHRPGEKVVLSVDQDDSDAAVFAEKLKLSFSGILEARVQENFANSTAFMENMKDIDGIILVKRLKNSRFATLVKEYHAAEMANVKILGAVLLKD